MSCLETYAKEISGLVHFGWGWISYVECIEQSKSSLPSMARYVSPKEGTGVEGWIPADLQLKKMMPSWLNNIIAIRHPKPIPGYNYYRKQELCIWHHQQPGSEVLNFWSTPVMLITFCTLEILLVGYTLTFANRSKSDLMSNILFILAMKSSQNTDLTCVISWCTCSRQ